MQAVKQTSPYIRKAISTKRMMTDVLIALIPVVAFSIYRFGWDAVIRIGVSIVVMVGLEALAFGMMHAPKKKDTFIVRLKSRYRDYTINNVIIPTVSAVIFAMIIPSKLPIYAVVVGAAFGIIVAKMLFGGTGTNIFNVAAAGRIFIGLALADMFTGKYVDTDLIAGGTALATAKEGLGFPQALQSYSLLDLFMGNVPGSMGEISAAAILIGAAYLLIRRSADYRVIVSSLLTFVILMALVGLRAYPDDALNFVLYQLFAGGLLFGAVYMLTDPVTSPVTRPGRYIYGMIVAALAVIIRLFGAYPEGVAFALLFGNMLVPLIDFPTWSTNRYKPTFFIGYAASLVVLGLIVYFSAGGLA
ncbi:MAG: RnfABCDGE type electron transport complex subunit D [Acholeplasmataceae bacterium]